MRLSLVNYNNLDIIKSNLPSLLHYFQREDSQSLETALETRLFSPTKFPEIEDFSLETDAASPNDTDFENIKRIYSSLKFLTPSQASDERLWAALCLGPFWRYTKYRWSIDMKCTVPNVLTHFFFADYPAHRALYRNSLARLWWIGKATYDSTAQDPWKKTYLMCNTPSSSIFLLENNFASNTDVINAIMAALASAKANGLKVSSNLVKEISKYLNVLGGTYLLDCIPQDRLSQNVYKKIEALQ